MENIESLLREIKDILKRIEAKLTQPYPMPYNPQPNPLQPLRFGDIVC